MQIEWQNKTDQSPYAYRQRANWTGVTVHRAHLLFPGKMAEYTSSTHDITITLSGKLTVEKNSASGKHIITKGSAGNLCLTPAGQPVGASWGKPLDTMGILLDPEFVNRTALENRFSSKFEFVEIYKNKDSLIENIALTLLAEAETDAPSGKIYTDSLIQTLTLHLLKNYSTANLKPENAHGRLSGYKLRRVQEFINSNLEEDLSLGEIAAAADLSQFHFARAFRASTGLTPQQYLMRQRIERAKDLLAENDLPIVEISLRTGFKNQSHFTTLFRKYTKFTPKLWRELKLA